MGSYATVLLQPALILKIWCRDFAYGYTLLRAQLESPLRPDDWRALIVQLLSRQTGT